MANCKELCVIGRCPLDWGIYGANPLANAFLRALAIDLVAPIKELHIHYPGPSKMRPRILGGSERMFDFRITGVTSGSWVWIEAWLNAMKEAGWELEVATAIDLEYDDKRAVIDLLKIKS